MTNPKEYLAVTAAGTIALNELVNKYIKEGWSLQGGVSIAHSVIPIQPGKDAHVAMLAQALTR